MEKLSFTTVKRSHIFIVILILTFICSGVYRILTFPVYIDEAITIVHFTNKGPNFSFSHYDLPNNHVFFSFLSALLNKILPFNEIVLMRLINLTLGVSSTLIIYRFIAQKYNYSISLITTSFFAFSYFTAFYSTVGRGYMLIIFFTLISIVLMEKMLKNFSTNNFLLLGATCVLGFLTIPIYLYVFISLTIYFAIRTSFNKKLFLAFSITHFCSGLLILLLYTPIFLNSGLSSITNNKWSKKVPTLEMFDFLKNSWQHFYDKIFGIRSDFILLPFLILMVFLYVKFKEQRREIMSLVLMIILPFPILILHSVIPGARTWCYLIIPFALCFALILDKLMQLVKLNKLTDFSAILMSVSIISVQIIIFKKSHPKSFHPNDVLANNITNKIKSLPQYPIYFMGGENSYECEVFQCNTIVTKKKFKILKELNSYSKPIILVNDLFGPNKIKQELNTKTDIITVIGI